MIPVRVRIPPSPTGEDLHIGNVYTALLNYIFAKKHNGKFIIRIEDTDRTRLVPGSEEKILSSLKWFGLTYDEGPDIGGPFAPYRQSDRLPIYRKYAEELVAKGHAFYCFCTPDRLEKLRKDQQEKKMPSLYDGLCKKIPPEEAKKRSAAEKHVIRLNVPDEGVTEFTDVVRGKITFENKHIDDQVLIKSDNYPTYHLGVVVDDHLMEISHVIRGEEWISSVPKHILLYTYFGWELPVFAHGPILRNPDKSKLSKRRNPVWASWYKEQGFLPEAVLNYLALMGWSMPSSAKASEGKPAEIEIFTLEEMAKEFRLEDIRAAGPVFDIKKLEWMNGEYIRKALSSQLSAQIYEFYEKKYPLETIEKTVPLIKDRIKKLSDYLPLCAFFFSKPDVYEMDLKNYKEMLGKVREALESLSEWKAAAIGDVLQETARKLDIKNSEFFGVLRVAITGKKISPPLNDSIELLGKTEADARLSGLSR